MPELPEVETIRRDLEKVLLGDCVNHLAVYDRRLMNKREAERWKQCLAGQVWKQFFRKGKYIGVELANGWRIMFHLRMTGQLLMGPPPATAGDDKMKLPRLRLHFASGRTLSLYDQRRFAEAWLLPPGQKWHSSNVPGPDALNELGREQFMQILKGRTTRIQPLLMDQHLMAGVGNIYAQEALFKASIRPTRPGFRITKLEASRLYETLQETLKTAIACRGSTSRNYRDANGESGSAQSLHAVYRKGGKACPRCGNALRTTRVGGRGSVFCRRCQR